MTRPDPDSADTGARLATGLIWGIKENFLAYLTRMPDSKSSVTKGALITPAQSYYFPLVSAEEYDASTGQGTLKFGGDVRFSGHHGMLFVMFVNPWVTFDGDHAQLAIADPASFPDLTRRLPLLDLVVRPWAEHQGARAWANLSTTLRPEGVELFNDVYAAGEPFDPIDIRVVV